MTMYFIAHVLPSNLNEDVLAYKKLMLEKYGCNVALKSPAHITLIPPCWMEDEKEQQLKNDLDKLSVEINQFQITTEKFSAFKPRTIFIAPETNEDLQNLKKKLDSFFIQHDSYKFETDSRPFHPHITIATRDLHKKDFAEAWQYFENKKFIAEWKAEGISLLRHNKKNWDVVHTSQFQ
ncbi:MAG: 2'-5' RNA ligase family protein [Flavisolibacter sp.]